MLNPLIKTKLNQPYFNSNMIAREHLLEPLKNSSGFNLILISGEAGSGKTSLIYQWVNKQNLKAAWYAPDVHDNDPDLFFRYILNALGNINEKIASLLRLNSQKKNGFPETDIIPFIIQNVTDIESDQYLIIDNYHLITNDVIHEAMSNLLNHLPPKFHLVILTRYSLPFPISNLRVRRRLLEIGSNDLRFTRKETEQFFTDILLCKLSPEQVKTVFQITEGWIGGLQLFGLAMDCKEAHQSLTENRFEISKNITDYLFDEVLRDQNEKVKRFLSMTCFLDKFNAEVCEMITGLSDSGAILNHIYRNNLFLVQLDNEGKWYRYRYLFSESLRKRYVLENFNEVLAIHRRAAEWFAQNNMLEEALNHALELKDYNLAISVFEDNLDFLIANHAALSFQKWIMRIPQKIRMQNAVLMLIECNVYIQSMQLSAAESILNELESRKDELLSSYSNEKRSLSLSFLKFEKCYLEYWRNPINIDVAYFENIHKELLPANLVLAYGMKLIIAASYVYKGEMNSAANILEEFSDKIKASESPLCIMRWFYFITTCKIHGGKLSHAELLIEEASKYLQQKGLMETPLRQMMDLPMAWLYLYRNELSKASEYLEDAMLQAEEAGIWGYSFESLYLNMLLNLANKNRPVTIRTLQKIQLKLPSYNVWFDLIEAFSAFLALMTGDEDKALQWISDKQPPSTKPASFLWIEENIIYVVVLRFFGRFQEAATILTTLREWCTEKGLGSQLLLIEIITAATLSDLGQYEQAEIHLRKAIVFAEREGHVRFFMDWAHTIRSTLRNIMNKDLSDRGYPCAPTIMKVCGIEFTADTAIHHSAKILSNREIEVLQLIVNGYKNKDISRRMFVSLDTVKTHIRHIYEKLKVNSKIDAIHQAEKLNIFPRQ